MGLHRIVALDGVGSAPCVLLSASAKTPEFGNPLAFLSYAAACERVRIRAGRAFRLRAHLRRLRASAALLGRTLPAADDEIGALVLETGRVFPAEDVLVSLVLRHIELPSTGDDESDLLICAGARRRTASSARLHLSQFRRLRPDPLMLEGKLAGFDLVGARALGEAREAGCDDALLLDAKGYVAGTTRANIFIVDAAGTLLTPPPVACVPGITRAAVLDLAADRALAFAECEFKAIDVVAAREVFLTSTTVGILPVCSAIGVPFAPGPVTRAVREAFDAVL